MRWSGSFSWLRSNRGILGDDKEKVKLETHVISDDTLTLQEEQQSLFFCMAALSSPSEGREMTSLKKTRKSKKRHEMKKLRSELCRGNSNEQNCQSKPVFLVYCLFCLFSSYNLPAKLASFASL